MLLLLECSETSTTEATKPGQIADVGAPTDSGQQPATDSGAALDSSSLTSDVKDPVPDNGHNQVNDSGQTIVDGGTKSDAGTTPKACHKDADCDDGDPCTTDKCQLGPGTCTYAPSPTAPGCESNSGGDPCTPQTTPGSSNKTVEACVCGLDSFCCETMWDQLCVDQAIADCEAPCGCKSENADLSCTSAADCKKCVLSGDLCKENWTCTGGKCVDAGTVECPSSGDVGCNKNTCVPETGQCAPKPNDDACADNVICTKDVCDPTTGQCSNPVIDGCGTNHPCNPIGLPGSKNQSITDCVCEKEPFCCSADGGWFSFCVATAEEQCNLSCDCKTLPPAELACTKDEDCGWCGDGNACNGVWKCTGGTCQTEGPVVCDTAQDKGCYKNTCNPSTGACEMKGDMAQCADDDPCTVDGCSKDTGQCTNDNKCGTNHPCQPVDWPGTADAEIQSCVCAKDEYCCENKWDSLCVSEAKDSCGAVCDCGDPTADISCTEDADCTWCSEDNCEAQWTCNGGKCVSGPGKVCDSSQDNGCLKNKCVNNGQCVMQADIAACDDSVACTANVCDAETGNCTNPPIEGCTGEPSFECKGKNEPSLEGCAVTELYEGCCDTWGRIIWCQETTDPNTNEKKKVTYCIDCGSINPFCGWQGSFYDCGTEGTAGPDEFPLKCQ